MYKQSKTQKKSKSSKLNGYSLHAIEFAGRKVENSDYGVYVTAREIERSKTYWDKLSNHVREKYKSRAKEYNVNVVCTKQRLNSLGQSLRDLEYEEVNNEEEKNRRRNELEQILRDTADISQLDNKVFYFVSASSFYESSNQIYPAEMALAKFSLKQGVFEFTSFEINPGKLEIGAAYEAQKIADATHRYQLPPDCFGESDYLKVLSKIVNFLPSHEELPIFFTEGVEESSTDSKALKSTQRIMQHIFDSAREYDLARSLKIYSVVELFYYLREITTDMRNDGDPTCQENSFYSIQDANLKFKSTDNEFKYNSSACLFHENCDVAQHCCLSKCFRYGYIISKWCAQAFKYELKPGFHFPKGFTNIRK